MSTGSNFTLGDDVVVTVNEDISSALPRISLEWNGAPLKIFEANFFKTSSIFFTTLILIVGIGMGVLISTKLRKRQIRSEANKLAAKTKPTLNLKRSSGFYSPAIELSERHNQGGRVKRSKRSMGEIKQDAGEEMGNLGKNCILEFCTNGITSKSNSHRCANSHSKNITIDRRNFVRSLSPTKNFSRGRSSKSVRGNRISIKSESPRRRQDDSSIIGLMVDVGQDEDITDTYNIGAVQPPRFHNYDFGVRDHSPGKRIRKPKALKYDPQTWILGQQVKEPEDQTKEKVKSNEKEENENEKAGAKLPEAVKDEAVAVVQDIFSLGHSYVKEWKESSSLVNSSFLKNSFANTANNSFAKIDEEEADLENLGNCLGGSTFIKRPFAKSFNNSFLLGSFPSISFMKTDEDDEDVEKPPTPINSSVVNNSFVKACKVDNTDSDVNRSFANSPMEDINRVFCHIP
mmetsp:Transcript_8525/g.12898  ORF Transcript_8525/g.12898 Transcript_8525/m.12898 type:complete len:459 (-) Transcript_8525:13-1389(-)